VDEGNNSKRARRLASEALGPMDEFAHQMAARRELKT